MAASTWRKSSYSAEAGDCVEVSPIPADIRVRDTKDRASGSLTFATLPWRTFLTHVTRSA
jgi:hypothetical protein